MSRYQLASLLFLLSFAAAPSAAHPPRSSWSVGVHIGPPAYPRPYVYSPWCYGVVRPYPYHYFYEPAPVIYETPILVRPAPVVVRPETVVVPSALPAAQAAKVIPASNEIAATIEVYLQRLAHADENMRRNAVMELGRMKAERAVEPLTATLAGDKSAVVRDAAARALGLISSPRALTALVHAAQADPDRDVRHSAQFAVEIIRTNSRN
ncbi:MAG: HEAT repeat domain-containing protein [Gemmataceae bacterium]|nr:HEAT repeat domain-containing protein [Gemmataceae bacterium]